MSRDMTKPPNWLCAQRRLRSTWASALSDQSLRCPHEESWSPRLPIKRTAKTLIRLGGCLGWSESSLGAQSLCWFCHVAAHMSLLLCRFELGNIQVSFWWCLFGWTCCPRFLFRWMKLRHVMLPVLMFAEPVFHSMVLGLMNSWAFNYLFGVSPLIFFLIHVLAWFLLDYSMLSILEVMLTCKGC